VSNSAKEVGTSGTIDCLDESKALIDAAIIEQNQGFCRAALGCGQDLLHGSPEGGGSASWDFKPCRPADFPGRLSGNAGGVHGRGMLDLIVRTLGYEPSMYAEAEKLWMLCRPDSAGAKPHQR